MVEYTGSLVQHPARVTSVWYLGLIVLGALLLRSERRHASGQDPISWLDSVFTATSAACVTGLAVRSTGNDFRGSGSTVVSC
jgi:trk system potassium uptake protein